MAEAPTTVPSEFIIAISIAILPIPSSAAVAVARLLPGEHMRSASSVPLSSWMKWLALMRACG